MTLKPFEEPCPRMQTPWPGLNYLKLLLYLFDAGRATRVAKTARLATQMLSVNCL